MLNTEMTLKIRSLVCEKDTSELFRLLPGTIYYKIAIEEAAKQGNTALVGELFERLGFSLNAREFTFAQQALLNQALSGFAMGLHFDQVKLFVQKGANSVYAVNALISVSNLTDENVSHLQACVEGTSQQSRLQEALAMHTTLLPLSN